MEIETTETQRDVQKEQKCDDGAIKEVPLAGMASRGAKRQRRAMGATTRAWKHT